VNGTCSSCGAPGEELAPVHRVWVIPEPTRDEELEWWCEACRAQYPHEDSELDELG
jgi:hypothetical protein